MNLTILKELLGLYKNDSTSNISLEKLNLVCVKIKDKPASKSNSPQLPPLCWNLLVQINHHHHPQSFSNPKIFAQTAKIVVSCARIIEASEKELKIGTLDLDKMVANVLVKLTEGVKTKIETEDIASMEELMEFLFERLHKHYSNLESKIRRMSLVEMPSINDPFANINLHSIAPDNTQDPTVKQLSIVALESMCRLILLLQKGPLENVLSALAPFHTENTGNVAHFVSSICKFMFWGQLEWTFWYWISDHRSVYREQLGYFKKRCHLPISIPTDPSRLDVKIISALLSSGLFVDMMLDVALNCNDIDDDEIIGSCLGLLVKEEHHVHVEKICKIIGRIRNKEMSDSGLKSILSAFDSLRNELFHLTRFDYFINLFTVVNEHLLNLNFPNKYYVSWTSCVLKSIIDNRKHLNGLNLQKLVRGSIAGLLRSYPNIPEDMKCKLHRIIGQALSTGADIQALELYLNELDGSLGFVLENSMFNLPQDYFNCLSCLVYNKTTSDILIQWVKVLSLQVHASSKAFNANDLETLHSLAKLILTHIFDQIKQAQYLEHVYNRMKEIDINEDVILLSKQMIVFKKKAGDKYLHAESHIQAAVEIISSFLETGKFVYDKVSAFDNLPTVINCVEKDLYGYLINLALVHASNEDFKNLVAKFANCNISGIYSICTSVNSPFFGIEVMILHDLYLQRKSLDALKLGYEKLESNKKTGIENTLETVELIIYLHRLSVSTNNLSESKYFLKQLIHLAETVKSDNITKMADELQNELAELTGNAFKFMSYARCENILKSASYKIFTFEHTNLMELDKFRKQLKAFAQSPITCNGVRIQKPQVEFEGLETSQKILNTAIEHQSSYFISEWAKICLFLQFQKTFSVSCDGELLRLFELARAGCLSSVETLDLKRLKGSIGMFCDEFMSVLWVLVVSNDSQLLLFKISLDFASFSGKMQKIHEICSNNTDSLRNTTEIADNAEMKAKWWKLRKSLDSELISTCSLLNDELFAGVSELLIPGTGSLTSRNLHSQLNELLEKLGHNVHITAALCRQLIQWGSCPKRFKIESLVKMLQLNIGTEEMDSIIIKIRKCFENAFDTGMPIASNPLEGPFNLILGKDLNIVPFESFPLFSKFIFKRTPLALTSRTALQSSETFEKVFYIVNPSGDLYQTQERFEGLFKGQPSWQGVIGRKPTADEFFNGICGSFDLFIYFGHSGGEIYAPLKELKKRLSNKSASSALLIGCSSGRIRSNGIFPAESSILHYLENESPLVLANLWDVTDKDIDMYIKRVLEDSDLLVPIEAKDKNPLKPTTAKTATIIEKAHLGRQTCFLKGLNGYAPIVYGLI